MTAGGEPDVLLEVVIDGLLAHGGYVFFLRDRLLDILEQVVDAPEVEWDMFALVSDDDLKVGGTVEDAVGD